METVTEVVKNMAGGDGEVTIKRILGEKELNGKCGLYAQVPFSRDLLLVITNIKMKARRITFFPVPQNITITEPHAL